MKPVEADRQVTNTITALIKHAKRVFHRQCVVLSGDQDWCHVITDVIFKHHATESILLIGNLRTSLDNVVHAAPKDALRFLGHEFDHAVIDFHEGVDPNVLGAISGTVSGGGLLMLLLPALDDLPDFDDPEKQRMAIWPHQPQDVGRRFLQRLANIIRDASDITLIQQSPQLSINVPQLSERPLGKPYLEHEICRTADQKNVVDAIQHVATGHRRRPLVIIADRGRGKSAALGIASALLMKNGTTKIIITGPRLRATDAAFKHAQQLLEDADSDPGKLTWNHQTLEFVAPDVLCRYSPDCHLLLVDEAAAIPAPLLEQLLDRYARIVFATTTYGYEGTGRGFAVKFQDTLHERTPNWRLLEMNTPVRWAPQDPAEAFVFRSLCLDARVERIESPSTTTVSFAKLDRDQLLHDEVLLSTIFGLLVLAHYQTQPRDLRYLMDAIGLDIYIVKNGGQLIGTAVVEWEGGLDAATANAVYRNERRVTGHLLPQTIESFVGISNASAARYCRIVRIAIHPDYRRKGIGSKLLQHIEDTISKQQVDIIGSNFGASEDLIRFWQNAGYLPAHVGLKRNASTGSNSVTYIKPLSNNGNTLSQTAVNKFVKQFPLQLAEPYHDLPCDIAQEIFVSFMENNKLQLTQQEWQDIGSFADSLRGYEINRLPIGKLVSHVLCHEKLKQLPGGVDNCLLIAKVLQQKSWQEIVEDFGFQGKQNAIEQLKNCIQLLIRHNSILDTIDVMQE